MSLISSITIGLILAFGLGWQRTSRPIWFAAIIATSLLYLTLIYQYEASQCATRYSFFDGCPHP